MRGVCIRNHVAFENPSQSGGIESSPQLYNLLLGLCRPLLCLCRLLLEGLDLSSTFFHCPFLQRDLPMKSCGGIVRDPSN